MRVKISFFLTLIVLLLSFTQARADIPRMINFQGVLKDTLDSPVPDGNYSITFRIYDSSGGGTVFWQEGKLVTVTGGLFSTLLGSAIAIPESVFADTSRWLGVQVGGDPEISPRTRLASLSYAYYAYAADFAQNADKLDGTDGSDFVHRTGPDSVFSTSGTSFYGRSIGSSASDIIGVRGFGQNPSSGNAYGGRFDAPGAAGTGNQYGVYGSASGFTASPTYGSYGTASNNSSGSVYGGYFIVGSDGTGTHYGVHGSSFSSSSAEAYGGYFQAPPVGTGNHYGVYGVGSSSSSASAYGSYGFANNATGGFAFGGYFQATSAGTGIHFGVYGLEAAGGGGAAVYASGDFAGSGAKYAVAKTSQGHRLLSVIESPEVWFEDFGEGQLVNGQANIELDPLFLETVTINTQNPMKVFIQLTSGNPVNVVVNKGTTGFDVTVSDNSSFATFDYRIVAKRKGYENQRLMATDIGMEDPNLYPELWDKMEKERQERQAEMEKSRIQK